MLKALDITEIKLRVTRNRLRQTWLIWGLVPLVICLALTLGVNAIHAFDYATSDRQLELSFQAIFAIAAMLFLIAFTVDGHWTNAQRLARRIDREVLAEGRRIKPDTLAEYAPVVFQSVYGSSRMLTLMGVATAITAVIGAAAGIGIYYALLVLALAAEYQLFVLSRHPYYLELMNAAAAGELTMVQAETEAHKKR